MIKPMRQTGPRHKHLWNHIKDADQTSYCEGAHNSAWRMNQEVEVMNQRESKSEARDNDSHNASKGSERHGSKLHTTNHGEKLKTAGIIGTNARKHKRGGSDRRAIRFLYRQNGRREHGPNHFNNDREEAHGRAELCPRVTKQPQTVNIHRRRANYGPMQRNPHHRRSHDHSGNENHRPNAELLEWTVTAQGI